MKLEKKKIAIIGGGASGIMAAITAASNECQVTIYEQADRIGKKILVTGNGKCNFSNKNFSLNNYYTKDKEFLNEIFSDFSVQDTISFFTNEGMLIKERDGYLYPYSEQASTVLDILRVLIEKKEVQILTCTKITSIVQRNEKYFIKVKDKTLMYDSVIIATGSPASQKNKIGYDGYEIAKKMGHIIVPIVPALVQLRCKEDYIKSIAGVRAQASISLLSNNKILQTEQGELQLTDYGVSGIPIFQLSRSASYELLNNNSVKIQIDFLSQIKEESFEEFCNERIKRLFDRTIEEFLLGLANKKINMLMQKIAGRKSNDKIEHIEKSELYKLLRLYKCFELHITSVNSLENAQVCAGGISTKELSTSLESKKKKNLYFCGEIIDVDGRCGGYNLQWAWSSGHKAGISASRKSDKI